jgi:hypothetical protein
MREIRELRSETQPEFAERFNQEASRLGLAMRYDFQDISKRETARTKMDAEDCLVLALLDPKRRGVAYVTVGKGVTVGRDAWALIAGQQPKAKGA